LGLRSQYDDLAGGALVHESDEDDVPEIVDQYLKLEETHKTKEAAAK
jgi:hypothetical protein